jgi:hypothetical protein
MRIISLANLSGWNKTFLTQAGFLKQGSFFHAATHCIADWLNPPISFSRPLLLSVVHARKAYRQQALLASNRPVTYIRLTASS